MYEVISNLASTRLSSSSPSPNQFVFPEIFPIVVYSKCVLPITQAKVWVVFDFSSSYTSSNIRHLLTSHYCYCSHSHLNYHFVSLDYNNSLPSALPATTFAFLPTQRFNWYVKALQCVPISLSVIIKIFVMANKALHDVFPLPPIPHYLSGLLFYLFLFCIIPAIVFLYFLEHALLPPSEHLCTCRSLCLEHPPFPPLLFTNSYIFFKSLIKWHLLKKAHPT